MTVPPPQVYLAASAVYGLEGALGDLEECARSISSGTTDTELAFLEDQVATAAAQVQQSELQVVQLPGPTHRHRDQLLDKTTILYYYRCELSLFIFFFEKLIPCHKNPS